MSRRTLLFVVLFVAGCGDATQSGATSGIAGRVTIGPQCPVVQEGSPCPDAPYAARITVSANGDTVEERLSGSDGAFRIPVAPGEYTVVAGPIDRQGIASGAPVQVVVEPDAYTRIDLSVDSGIR